MQLIFFYPSSCDFDFAKVIQSSEAPCGLNEKLSYKVYFCYKYELLIMFISLLFCKFAQEIVCRIVSFSEVAMHLQAAF